MIIDWASFSPGTALAGGIVIGLAASMFALMNGRVAGISGIVGGLMRPAFPDATWRIAFVAGLIVAPIGYRWFAPLPDVVIDASYPTLVAAGLAVGIGTRYASGCTSGHGVCGVARLSPRSLVATVVFVGTGIFTVFATRHLLSS